MVTCLYVVLVECYEFCYIFIVLLHTVDI